MDKNIYKKKKRGDSFLWYKTHSSRLFRKKKKKENRGFVEFQVFSWTNKIRRLPPHLELHRKKYSSQRGFRKILGKRQRLLSYLSKKKRVLYKYLINQLGIRESNTR